MRHASKPKPHSQCLPPRTAARAPNLPRSLLAAPRTPPRRRACLPGTSFPQPCGSAWARQGAPATPRRSAAASPAGIRSQGEPRPPRRHQRPRSARYPPRPPTLAAGEEKGQEEEEPRVAPPAAASRDGRQEEGLVPGPAPRSPASRSCRRVDPAPGPSAAPIGRAVARRPPHGSAPPLRAVSHLLGAGHLLAGRGRGQSGRLLCDRPPWGGAGCERRLLPHERVQ